MTPAAERPSLLLFVMDTTRADSVSAYGAVEGTTPALDALAASGVRYAHAYASAPWTLPSHATLFTGLLPHEHGVSWRRTRAPDELVTIAELLRDAGYQTVGFAENAWVGNAFNLSQGFEHFEMVGRSYPPLDVALARWSPQRDPGRPLFVFVNVVDPHAPYDVREENRYLPAGVTAERAAAVPQGDAHYMCRASRFPAELAILRGLYLGDVAAADAKLAATLATLRATPGAQPLVTIATSDHGEHFGESELVGHVAGLGEALVHVPLVVHGAGGPAVVETPVGLTAVAPTVLALAGVPAPRGLPSAPLPRADAGAGAAAPVVAEWTDPRSEHERDAHRIVRVHRSVSEKARRRCEPRHRAFGDMRTLIRYPYQLTLYDAGTPTLVDLRTPWPSREDLSERRADLTRQLTQALAAETTRSAPVAVDRPPAPERRLTKEVEDELRALGYLE